MKLLVVPLLLTSSLSLLYSDSIEVNLLGDTYWHNLDYNYGNYASRSGQKISGDGQTLIDQSTSQDYRIEWTGDSWWQGSPVNTGYSPYYSSISGDGTHVASIYGSSSLILITRNSNRIFAGYPFSHALFDGVVMNNDGKRIFFSYSKTDREEHGVNFYKFDSQQYGSTIYSYRSKAWIYEGLTSVSSFDCNSEGTRVIIGDSEKNNEQGYLGIYTITDNPNPSLASSVDKIFELNGNNTASNLGLGVAMSDIGTRFAVSSIENSKPKIEIYDEIAGIWSLSSTLLIDSELAESGMFLSMSGDGNWISIGSSGTDGSGGSPILEGQNRIHVYKLNNNNWILDSIFTLSGEYASTANFDFDGSRIHISSVSDILTQTHVFDSTVSPELAVSDINSFYECNIGESLTIDATPSSGSEPYTFEWFHNGFKIPSIYGGSGNSYTIVGDEAYEGDYVLKITNPAGESQYDFKFQLFNDSDNDGISDGREVNVTFSDPYDTDSDNDLLSDGDEISLSTNPLSSDSDNDGFDDYIEHTNGMDPTVADSWIKEYIINNSSNFSIYTTDQIQDLRPGSTMIEVSGSQATVQLQMEESSDLQTWEDKGDPATMTIPADTDTKFFRFKMAE
ncbi:MSCRAMM family adhesin SdrC [Opitutae bacterium]|nr:MSCRAMM family adhesin SdrC [Opitutae bacterium]